MSGIQITLLALALGYPLMCLAWPKLANAYARLAVLCVVGAIMLMPFAWLISAAVKDPSVMNSYTFLPPPDKLNSETVNLKNFEELLKPKPTLQGTVSFWRHVGNSLFLASTSTIVSMIFCSMAGYALAKHRFAGRAGLMSFMLASMSIPGIVLLAPSWEIIYRIGWMDTYWALLVPGCVSAFGVFLYRQAMMDVPDELLEAGRIDGCSEFGIYLTVVMPLVRPMTGAFCLIMFMGSWNSFIGPNVYLQTQSLLPLPVVLNQYIGEYSQQYGVFLAGTLIAILPPAALFFALQREFISGLTAGAVKQ